MTFFVSSVQLGLKSVLSNIRIAQPVFLPVVFAWITSLSFHLKVVSIFGCGGLKDTGCP